ncbi:MAG TPA: FAD-linked oxidase C-terminal domain-containing protein, partial [Patescibacteria group bacterium]|nr:FAD-linked oxidase C-terminal domain-containing protein [Patescibacteria group bacterium]
MTSAQQRAVLTGANCEIAFDNLTRQLYATDASLYQIEPAAVAFPRDARQAGTLVQAALQAGVPVVPRGAGTGLAGGAIGEGLIIDFSRHNRAISDLDLERESVRVGAGVVLDELNRFLRPHGYCFGPDVATSSRATLGGMIANNSSGSHAPVYGTTANHVRELEIITSGGQIVMVGAGHDTLRAERELIRNLLYFHAATIEEWLPPGLSKRHPGYALERCIREPTNLNHLLCGSEGTLAAIVSAEVGIVRLPKRKGVALIFFDAVADAMQATVELLDLKPAAIEHVDRLLLDQTQGQREFRAARDLMELDQKPAEAVLVVEFIDHVEDGLTAVARKQLGARTKVLQSVAEAELVWALRKAGLSLLTGRKGAAKPVTGIEDTAVRPEKLPEYVRALQSLLGRVGVEASFYGHAASGLLHVRPVLDLNLSEDLRKFRELADEISAVVRQFKGSLAAEHGVGIARTEYMPEQLGEALVGVMREIKEAFDPHHLFNPGKIIPDGRYLIDGNLRSHDLKLPFKPVLAFAAKDESFLGNLQQCNGCGGCRKETPTMCPTFLVTREELLSTRGRANVIRAALERRGVENGDSLASAELEAALGSCLSCKACNTECPSNVNMSLLKAELQHARIRRHGLSWRQRLISSVDLVGEIGCKLPTFANAFLESFLMRTVFAKGLKLAWQRPLPHFATQRFDRWFAHHQRPEAAARGRVVLWDDTFVRYHEPHIGIAATKVLEAAGFEVALPIGRRCCGRPAFSQGHLTRARNLARRNIELLNLDMNPAPIIFLEPSCYSMFIEDYRELRVAGWERIAQRCFLFEQFMEELLAREPSALRFRARSGKVVIHAHCHVKSLLNPAFLRKLGLRLPGREVTLLDSACCGMAGAFGAMQERYELSLKIAEPLLQTLRGLPSGTAIVASGTSCRQ